MSALQPLEKALDDLFVKKVPALPDNVKKAIVQYLPWINLVLGVFTLLSAYWLWHWANTYNSLVNGINALSNLYGGQAVASTNKLGVALWLGVAFLVIEGVLYVLAFPATRDRKKNGWDLMFYALLVNVVYGLVTLFNSYGVSHVFSSLIGTAIGLYFLFQIRASYSKGGTKEAKESKDK